MNVERRRKWYIRELLSSLYADDAGVIFATRKDLEDGFKILYKHFARFGLLIHVARRIEDKNTGELIWGKSKTEIMYIPQFGCNCEDANASIIHADDGNGIARFANKFK